MTRDVNYILFRLLRTAIGTQEALLNPDDTARFQSFGLDQWQELFQLVKEQSIAAISLDGFEQICAANPDLNLVINDTDEETCILKWSAYRALTERKFKDSVKAIQQLAQLFSEKGISMMVFKGYSMSLEYPIPSHRVCGDIDCFLYSTITEDGKEKLVRKAVEGDSLISKELKLKVIKGDKHSIFHLGRSLQVENHSRFLYTRQIPELAHTEDVISSMALNSEKDERSGCWRPSVLFNSILLPFHMANHFVFRGSSLKQLLDWALFLKNHKDEIDWDLLLSTAERTGSRKFIEAINLTASNELGIPAEGIPTGKSNEEDVKRIIKEITSITPPKNAGLGQRLKKYNIWLRRYHLVYKGSLVRYFLLNFI